jgi:DNA-binding response OmpR family regulator
MGLASAPCSDVQGGDPVHTLDDGTLHANFRLRTIELRDDPVTLTSIEWMLLRVLTEHRGEILSPQRLNQLLSVYGNLSADRMAHALVRLRWKLGRRDSNDRDWPIHVVTGFGPLSW